VIVTTFGNGLPSLLWSHVFEHVISIERGQPTDPVTVAEHTVFTGDPGDTRFLYSVLDQATNLRALVIDDTRYASAMSCYYLLGRAIKRPGIVIFTPTAAQHPQEIGTRHLVDHLRTGVVDNHRHVIVDVTPEPGGPGMSYELLR